MLEKKLFMCIHCVQVIPLLLLSVEESLVVTTEPEIVGRCCTDSMPEQTNSCSAISCSDMYSRDLAGGPRARRRDKCRTLNRATAHIIVLHYSMHTKYGRPHAWGSRVNIINKCAY